MTTKKAELYIDYPENRIFSYLFEYVYDDLAYIIIDYIIPIHGNNIKSINVGRGSSRMCVYGDKVYILNKYFDRHDELHIFSVYGNLIEIVGLDNFYENICVNNKYIYLQYIGHILRIFDRTSYKEIKVVMYWINIMYVDENNIYVMNEDYTLSIFSHDGNYLRDIGSFTAAMITGDENYIYIQGAYTLDIYDKTTFKLVKKFNNNICGINTITFRNNNLICGMKNQIYMYDIESEKRVGHERIELDTPIKIIDITKSIKEFDNKTKIISIDIVNDKLYILDNKHRIHILI